MAAAAVAVAARPPTALAAAVKSSKPTLMPHICFNMRYMPILLCTISICSTTVHFIYVSLWVCLMQDIFPHNLKCMHRVKKKLSVSQFATCPSRNVSGEKQTWPSMRKIGNFRHFNAKEIYHVKHFCSPCAPSCAFQKKGVWLRAILRNWFCWWYIDSHIPMCCMILAIQHECVWKGLERWYIT